MKTDIHPELQEVTIRCACGAEFRTKSTRDDFRIEICSSCHPFYTGRQQRATVGGRIERFRKKYGYVDGEDEGEDEAKSG